MLFLKRDTSNTVVLTLQENATITATTPNYLFEFISDDSNVAKLFTATDSSSNVCRYNQFIISVTGGTENLTGGTIDLTNNGYYKYNVYEQVSATNLAISGTTSKVETGKMFLSGTTLPIITEYTDQTNTKFVYNG